MALEVVSSILVARPTFLGCSQVVKAPDFDSGIRWFKSSHPSHNGPLAQTVEHLTFNQGVPSSNLGWTTTHAALAQLVEQMTLNHWAQGSSP